MVAFQGRALKLETVHKVTFPSKCHVFHLRNAFCHRAASALQTDLLQQELPEKPPRESRASLASVLQTASCKGAAWAASPSLRFAADPSAGDKRDLDQEHHQQHPPPPQGQGQRTAFLLPMGSQHREVQGPISASTQPVGPKPPPCRRRPPQPPHTAPL